MENALIATPETRKKEREKIEADIKEFLNCGGEIKRYATKIKTVENTMSVNEIHEWRKRLEAAKKR